MATGNENPNEQTERQGGYGGSSGGRDPMQGTPSEGDTPSGTGAGGRDNPVTSPMDADEALGNRTGGYGGNPATTTSDQPDGATGE